MTITELPAADMIDGAVANLAPRNRCDFFMLTNNLHVTGS